MEKMAKFESLSRGQSILERCELDGVGMNPSVNVLGTELQTCSNDPKTGWYRDGCCNTDENDRGSHTVCCVVTDAFLEYARQQGNDLVTPAPQFSFPGLKAGDSWCVCARTWLAAVNSGKGCPVDLEATHEEALSIISLEVLEAHAV
jgi:hypothetical protein